MTEKQVVIHDPSAWPSDSRVNQSHHSKQGSIPQRHSIKQTLVQESAVVPEVSSPAHSQYV